MTLAFKMGFFFISFNSKFKNAKSNSALCMINFFPFINSKKSFAISENSFFVDKKLSEYPCTL